MTMSSLQPWQPHSEPDAVPFLRITTEPEGYERREHRRCDLEHHAIPVHRWDASRGTGEAFGVLIDISAGGVRIRARKSAIRPDNQIRIRLELPEHAGISPFVQHTAGGLRPIRQWVGWMAVTRVQSVDEQHVDVAGRLVEMDAIDRGMLGLYLSTQPLAA
jgi:hypothetical protein